MEVKLAHSKLHKSLGLYHSLEGKNAVPIVRKLVCTVCSLRDYGRVQPETLLQA